MRNQYLIALFIALFVFIAVAYALPNLLVGERTLPNLFLEGTNVGNLRSYQLKDKIDDVSVNIGKKEVKFIYENQIKTFSLAQLGVVPQKEGTFDQIANYGKTGFITNRWYYIFYTLRNKTNFTLQKELDREKAYKAIYNFVQEYAVKPQDAKLIISDKDEITTVPAVVGKQADISNALEQLERLINSDLRANDYEIKIAQVNVNPDITDEDIKNMRITGKIAEVTTYFNAANKERTHNIKIASDKLQDYVVPPGANFSFNDAVGPRTREAGYKDAMIIVENEFEPGLGGGICQVSSTIYNAALKANLPIVERRRHSLLVNYVPPGLDATVVYGFLDFKFENNTDGYLWIRSEVNKNSLTIKIFGWDEKIPYVSISRNETVIQPPVEYIEDPALPKGEEIVEEEGKVGYKVQVIRTVKNKEGKILSQETVSSDTYPPSKKVIRKGMADVVAPETEENIEQEEQQIQDSAGPEESDI